MFPSVAFRPLRLLVISAALAVVAMVVAGVLGQFLFGAFLGVGLALGLVNALLVRQSVASITATDHPLKSQMALNSATRLLVITAIALTIAGLLARHGGLGVVVGLAVFQVILILGTMVPVVKKLRSQGPQTGRAEGTALE